MRLTRAHADFWMAHLSPSFIRATLKRPTFHGAPNLVDACVNDHVEPLTKRRTSTEPHNTVHVVRMHKRNRERLATTEFRLANPELDAYSKMPDYEFLEYLAHAPHSDEDRAKWARRFMRGLINGRRRRS